MSCSFASNQYASRQNAAVKFKSASCALFLGGGLLLGGCGTAAGTATTPIANNHLTLSGVMHGGQQPVTGASVQLYAVGTQGDGSNAKALLQDAVLSDQNGNFSITLDYICPSQSTLVYLVGTGGNPGLSSGTDNKALSMMAALGACGSLTASTAISVNELTTIGSIAALYPYMTAITKLGSGTSDATQLGNAFALVNEYTDIGAGAVPGPTLPAGYYASSVEIQTLGDIVGACVNSSGGRAGDGSACGNLFTLATPSSGTAPKETIGAILDILNNPTSNVAAIFNLSSATGPFQPSLSGAPVNWSLPILSGPASPTFSPAAGTYSGSRNVTISSTSGATIYYTTDGSTPTSGSALYSSPIALPIGSTTLEAIAYLHGSSSNVTSAMYTIMAGGQITVNANLQTAISAKMFGANNIWYYVQGSSFTNFANGLKNVGVTGLRFPGGYESEHYIWDQSSPVCNTPCMDNDDDEYLINPGGKPTLYKNYWQNNSYSASNPNAPWSPGATPAQAKAAFPGNVAFAVRTLDAMEANTTSVSNSNNWNVWAAYAAHLVTAYGYDGQDWLIGNEWYNDAYNNSDAHKDPVTWANLYGTALSYYVPAMKAAAFAARININIYASTLYEQNTSQDPAQYLTNVISSAGPAWAQVDGLDVHPYSGNNPNTCSSGTWITDPIDTVGADIQALINTSRKSLVFASEWSADLEDNKGPDPCNNPQVQKGLENANDMVQLFGQLAQGGVTAATYYPPVEVAPWGGANCQPDGTCPPVENASAQDGTVTLLNSTTYTPDANGQAMDLLSTYYRGSSPPVTVSNSTVTSIAALNGTQPVIFIMGGGTASNEAEVVQVNGVNWSHVALAKVLWYDPANASESLTGGAVSFSDITSSVSVVPVNGQNTAQFAINPGGPGRGSSWEIVMLVLQ
jgi:hypothetical protein